MPSRFSNSTRLRLSCTTQGTVNIWPSSLNNSSTTESIVDVSPSAASNASTTFPGEFEMHFSEPESDHEILHSDLEQELDVEQHFEQQQQLEEEVNQSQTQTQSQSQMNNTGDNICEVAEIAEMLNQNNIDDFEEDLMQLDGRDSQGKNRKKVDNRTLKSYVRFLEFVTCFSVLAVAFIICLPESGRKRLFCGSNCQETNFYTKTGSVKIVANADSQLEFDTWKKIEAYFESDCFYCNLKENLNKTIHSVFQRLDGTCSTVEEKINSEAQVETDTVTNYTNSTTSTTETSNSTFCFDAFQSDTVSTTSLHEHFEKNLVSKVYLKEQLWRSSQFDAAYLYVHLVEPLRKDNGYLTKVKHHTQLSASVDGSPHYSPLKTRFALKDLGTKVLNLFETDEVTGFESDSESESDDLQNKDKLQKEMTTTKTDPNTDFYQQDLSWAVESGVRREYYRAKLQGVQKQKSSFQFFSDSPERHTVYTLPVSGEREVLLGKNGKQIVFRDGNDFAVRIRKVMKQGILVNVIEIKNGDGDFEEAGRL